MASGGFAYASASVTYHAADYGTNYDWALALHRARVTAFLRASYRTAEVSPGDFSGAWPSASPASYGSARAQLEERIEYDPAGHPGLTMTVYIQDVNGPAQTSYPAFVTVFENPDSSTQFAIITSRGYHNVTGYVGDATRGFYIPVAKCLTCGNSRRLPYAFAHAFGANKLSSFDVSGDLDQGTLASGELPICPSYGLAAYTNTSNVSSSGQASVITAPTEGVTYQFGYAIKGLAIEGFYKTSGYPSGVGAMWDLSGAIFDGDLGWDVDTVTFSGTVFGYYSPYVNINDRQARSVSDSFFFAGTDASVDALDKDGQSYAQQLLQSGASVLCNPACSPGYIPQRSNSTIGEKLMWSTACVAWSVAASYNAIRNLPSIDGQGNSVKGFLRDDIFRFVSIFATRIGGTTFQGGNFIGMNCGQQSSGFEVGVLLGWDDSNANDIL